MGIDLRGLRARTLHETVAATRAALDKAQISYEETIASFPVQPTFGSDIQHDVSMKVLTEFLEAWKMNVESAHTKNSVQIDYGPPGA